MDKILQPGLLPGAVDVFLDFICYSGGPLPEEMLPAVKVNLYLLHYIHPTSALIVRTPEEYK